ncbi:MAG: peptidoglycan recognition protein family protein [Solirubrobacteraceae bacterium]
MRRPAAIAAALLAVALAAGCGRAERSPTDSAAAATTAAPGATTSEAERNAQRNLEGAEANAASNTQSTTPKPAKTQTAKPPAQARPTAARPAIVQRPIPFGSKRREEMRAYALRHYGIDDFHLRNPKVIVEHYTATDTFQAAYATFANDVPDVELHELPGTCAHFIVDKDGTIYQLVSLTIMCRHTVGLNWTAFGIEQVGLNAREIVIRRAQYTSVLRLTAWLRCRYAIALRNVIGHDESLSSPYHHENVAALRRQTHADWTHAEMTPVRARVGRYRCAG